MSEDPFEKLDSLLKDKKKEKKDKSIADILDCLGHTKQDPCD